jgi:hypothetical protein
MKLSKQKLIDSGISENCIVKDYTCNKCRGILVGQKPLSMDNIPRVVCVDCATSRCTYD